MDNRLIEKIEIYEKGIESVKAIRPVTYHQKGKPVRQIGLVSQEVQALEPLTVNNSASGLVINYDSLIPILINSIKELSKQVEELQAITLSKKVKK